MPNTIDAIQLEISADAAAAERSLGKLAETLAKLQKKISGLNVSNLSAFSTAVNTLSQSANRLDSSKLTQFSDALSGLSRAVRNFAAAEPKMNSAAAAMEKLAGLNLSNLHIDGDWSGISTLARGMGDFADAAQRLASVRLTDINRALRSLQRLQSVDLSGLAQGVQGLSGTDFTTLNNLGTAVQNFTNSLAGADKVAANTTKIFTALSQLAVSAGNLPVIQQNLPAVSQSVMQFISVMAGAPAVSSGTVSLLTALSGLASAGNRAKNAAAALPAVTAGVRDFIQTLSTMPYVRNDVLRAVEALSRLASAGAQAGSASRSLQNSITGLSGSVNTLRSGIGGVLPRLRSFARQLLSVVGLTGGIYMIGKALRSSITYASDLAEAQNVVNIGFGNLSYMADDFAESAIYSFGMSELAAKNTAGQFAAMGNAMGLMPEKAAEMAINLTKLSGDLASFWNVSQDIAKTALDSVFTGETESLKKFGIVMTQTNLQQFAYSQGINKSISAMTQAEQTMLRYQYVLQNTADAQGDFARTSGGWAGQIRILKGQLQDLAGIIGTGLITVFLPVVKVINLVIAKIIQLANVIGSFFSKLFGLKVPELGAGAGLAEVAESAGNVAGSTESAAEGISDVGNAAKKAEKDMNGFVAGWHEVNNMTASDTDSGAGSGVSGDVALPDMSIPSEYEVGVTADDQASPVLDKIIKRLMELKKFFMEGFAFGLGDVSVFDSIQDNLERIGKSLNEIFTDRAVVRAFNDMLDTLVYNAGTRVGAFVSVGATIADNLTGGMALYLERSVGRIQQWLISMFDLTAQTDTILTNFTVALADILSVFRSPEAKEITASIIQIFSDAFMMVTELAFKLGRDMLDTILSPIVENAGGFKTALQNTMSPIAELLSTLAQSFRQTWDEINAVYDEHIAPLFASVRDGLSQIVETLLDGYNTYMAPVLDDLAGKFSSVWDGTIHPLLTNFIGLFGDVADLVKAVWENIFQPLVDWIAGSIFPVVSPVLEAVGSVFSQTFESIGEMLDGFITAARGVLDFLTGVFSGDWSAAWEGVQKAFRGIWDAMPDIIKKPIQMIIDMLNKMIGGIEGGVNAVIRRINKLSFNVPDWVPEIGGQTFGFNLSEMSLPRIPGLAKGGIVTKATLAVIGEDGAEAVVPLEQNIGWISRVADNLFDQLGGRMPVLDLAVDVDQYRGKLGRVKDIRQSDTAQGMEQLLYLQEDIRRQNSLLEDIITAIENKQIQIGDVDVFKSAQRGQRQEYRRTRRVGWAGID